jgi:cbb3-type cytochrome oxidase maturation protein
MGIIFFLIPISLVLLGFACWAFFWAVGSGQFEDLDSQAWDILAGDEPQRPPGEDPGAVSGDERRC